MENKFELSMIVPVYNGETTIRDTLDSLLAQTLPVLIVVINDGSTDGTAAILEEIASKHENVVVYTKENGGIADTRNYALSKITTEYFGFLDSDDTVAETMAEVMLKEAHRTGAEVVVSHFNWVTSSSVTLKKEGPYRLHKGMLVNLWATLWNKIYKTEFVKQTGIQFPTGNRYEDACFLYCLTPHIHQIAFVDEAFVNYIQREGSITHNNNNEVKNMITVFKIIVDTYRQQGIYERYHDELEYLHIKFFLGNSFLRSSRIRDRHDRHTTILMGWNLLNEQFPKWHRNPYLKQLPGMKNKYFRCVYRWNIMIFAWLFRHFKKDKI